MRPRFIDPTLESEGGRLKAEVGSPVRLHHLPNWLRLRLLKLITCKRFTHGDAVAFEAQREFGLTWLDHWGSTWLPDHDNGGRPVNARGPAPASRWP